MNANEYIEHWDKNRIWEHLKWPRHQQRFKTIASYLYGKTFADVGCAFGHSTFYLKRFRSGEWTGIDFVEKAIEKAGAKFQGIDFRYLENIDALKFCSQFDGVVCSEVIEHDSFTSS